MNYQKTKTSWDHVGQWYSKLVDTAGHYYHQTVIIPGVLKLLNLDQKSSLVDFACGQGVLARNIPSDIYYYGLDIAPSLIDYARKENKNKLHNFEVTDVAKPLKLNKKFTHAAIILALQNIENVPAVFKNADQCLFSKGKFLMVINHPYFRIPRQTSWEIDDKNKMQFRRINRYLSPLKIPINQHPGSFDKSPITWSYHYPLSLISQHLLDSGFAIRKIEEWISNKTSVGKNAKMENRSRNEFPLFMAILAEKIN